MFLHSHSYIFFLLYISDPVFHLKVEDDGPLLEAVKQPWVEQKSAMQIDISILQMVEDLEHRVVGADLQLKVRQKRVLVKS